MRVSFSETDIPLPVYADIISAAKRLKGKARRTPLLESKLLNDQLGGRLLIKPECLQLGGAFKFRGAYNAIEQLVQHGASGVAAYSSGNHAQGVALAASMLGVEAVIVMPKDAPKAKIENTRGFGAEVVLYDRYFEVREEIGEKIATERGLELVRPYDNADVIAGQGTVGLEIIEDVKEMGLALDAVVAPVGGGGLVAGMALAMGKLSPRTQIWGVEPQGFDDTRLSIKSGARMPHDEGKNSICDSLLANIPGELTFALNHELLHDIVTVSDQEVLHAMHHAFHYLKVVSEPGGATALAAVLADRVQLEGKTVCAVISGGNVDGEIFKRALESS